MAVCFTSTDYHKLAVSFLLAALFAPCLCAPPTAPWWYNPSCPIAAPQRHGRSAHDPPGMKLIKLQMKTFLTHVIKSQKDLHQLYKASHLMGSDRKPSLNWLRVKKMVHAMDASPETFLQEFYKALEYFAGTLDVLKRSRVQTQTVNFDHEARLEIFKKVINEMRLLICEIQDALESKNQAIPDLSLRQMKIPVKKLRVLDHTDVQIYDINLFKRLKNFLGMSQKRFRTKKSKQNHVKVLKSKRTKI